MRVAPAASHYKFLGIKCTASQEDIIFACEEKAAAEAAEGQERSILDDIKATLLHSDAKKAHDRNLLRPTIPFFAEHYDGLPDNAAKEAFRLDAIGAGGPQRMEILCQTEGRQCLRGPVKLNSSVARTRGSWRSFGAGLRR